MATTGKTKGLENMDENKATFADTTLNSGKYDGVMNENNPTQASETSPSGKGWSRSDENADASHETGSRDVSEESNVSRLTDRLGNNWSNVQENAQEFLNKAQGVASDYAHKAQDFSKQAVEKSTSTIREYPLQSLLVGFGVGCLVGLLVPRR